MMQSESTGNSDDPLSFRVVGGILLGLFLVALGLFIFPVEDTHALMLNLYTEMISVVSIGYILNLISKSRSDEQLKAQLLRELNASSGIAMRAVEELRARGWLMDGSLNGMVMTRAHLDHAQLTGARLEKVQLTRATLFGSNLRNAILKEADLGCANISNATLWGADLSSASLFNTSMYGAKLQQANLSHSDLCFSDLRNARLEQADLSNAKVHGADFTGANLKGAKTAGLEFFSCILPDSSKAIKPEDFLRFT
jgi:uncharacterized protein YjbI with pentapeptide repeats